MNKITWITGAGSGIGKAVVEKLSSRELYLAISGRRKNILDDIANKNNVKAFPMDVSDKTSVDDALNKLQAEGFVNCLINNAGIGGFKSVEEHNIEDIENIISTNLLGSIYTIKSVLPEMIKNGEGIIINILSVVAEKIFKNGAAYTASKIGLLGFTDVLREEVREHNIKVINIVPGATATPIWGDMLEKYGSNMMNPEDIAEVIDDIIHLKGKAVPEKVVLRSVFGDL